MQNRLVGVVFEVSRWYAKLYTFANQLMDGALRKYASIQICDVKCIL